MVLFLYGKSSRRDSRQIRPARGARQASGPRRDATKMPCGASQPWAPAPQPSCLIKTLVSALSTAGLRRTQTLRCRMWGTGQGGFDGRDEHTIPSGHCDKLNHAVDKGKVSRRRRGATSFRVSSVKSVLLILRLAGRSGLYACLTRETRLLLPARLTCATYRKLQTAGHRQRKRDGVWAGLLFPPRQGRRC